MLKLNLLHPEILQSLGSNGHGGKLLIADGNFPISTRTPVSCKKVFLNLAPGMLTVTDILRVIRDFIPVEKYLIMVPPDGAAQPIHAEFKNILGDLPCEQFKRMEFYAAASSADVFLAIASGEKRRFGNIILEIGVVA
jgi:L-fucose mutarotase